MIARASYICAFLLFGAVLLHAEFRKYTNDWGDSIEAELIEVKDGGSVVKMKLKNGRKIDASLAAFSEADRKFIRNWWKEEVATRQVLHEQARLTLDVTVESKTRNDGYTSYYSKRDDTLKSYYPQVVIDNAASQTFTGNEVRLVAFARDMRYKDQILVVSANSMKADFKERTKTVLESKAFRLRHYEYESSYSNYEYEYGYKYTGYAIVIKNSKGEVIQQEATKSRYLNPDLIFKCKSGEMYDVDFKRKLDSTYRSSSYYVD